MLPDALPTMRWQPKRSRPRVHVVRGRHLERLLQLPRPAGRCRRGDKAAIIFEADDGKVTHTTYAQLLTQTCRMANALKALGIGKGDRGLARRSDRPVAPDRLHDRLLRLPAAGDGRKPR
jgi:hypothetical protein